jgi:hypothetical protein
MDIEAADDQDRWADKSPGEGSSESGTDGGLNSISREDVKMKFHID